MASESYKFARLYPLNQEDLPAMGNYGHVKFVDTTTKTIDKGDDRDNEQTEQCISSSATLVHLPVNVGVENSRSDYTPGDFITNFFTDLGVLTPSAISDELIQLYQ